MAARLANFPARSGGSVVAEQFAWNFHYPGPDASFGATDASLISVSNPLGIDRNDPRARDDIGILNVMTLPVGRPIIVHLSSRDVVLPSR